MSRPSGRSTISCIIPAYNAEAYLAESIASIVAQTYAPAEIIVVDDGSTDATAAVVAGMADSAAGSPDEPHIPVRYLHQENAGPAAARNAGLRSARGALVAFLDADDRWHPQKLERQMDRFAARPELDVSVTHIQNFWISELRVEEERLRDNRIAAPIPGYVSFTMLARRRAFERVGPFDESLAHGNDTDWFLRARHAGVTAELIPEVLVYRRLHRKNRSRENAERSRIEFLRLVKAHLDRRRHGTGSGDGDES